MEDQNQEVRQELARVRGQMSDRAQSMSEDGGNDKESTKSEGGGQVRDCRTVRGRDQINCHYSSWSAHETSGILSLDEA